MDIRLQDLSEHDRESFVDGFEEAAKWDFPHFDADMDNMSLQPWSRPWETEPVTMVWQGPDHPSARTLGKHWFWIVREDMLRQTRWQCVPGKAVSYAYYH